MSSLTNPTLYVIAGPNGIGKTTSFYDTIPVGTVMINADDIAKQLREQTGDINIQEIANGEAVRQMNLYLKDRKSFGFETNLADLDTWKFIEGIKIIGYTIVLVFICVDDVDICIKRVESRVKEGGHFVRPDIIKLRYENGLKLLKHYLFTPNIIILIDNKYESEVVLQLNDGVIIEQSESLPNWAAGLLPKESTKTNTLSIDEIRKRYNESK